MSPKSRLRNGWGLVASAVWLVMACRSEPPREPRDEERITTPQGSGDLEGRVRLVGSDIPEPTPILNTTDPAICGRKQSLENLVVSRLNRGIAHVIVAFKDVPASAVSPAAPGLLVLDNVGCRFVPHASVLTVGSTLEAVNSDPLLHTVHLYGPSELNISLPVEGARIRRTLDRLGLFAVRCDVHGWMQAFIRVDPHPFHAVTDGSGFFRIEKIPPGAYSLELWHEKLGRKEVTVQIASGETSKIDVEYTLPVQ